MMHIDASERINRPVSEVFRFVATEHVQNHPKWDPNIVEMKQTSDGPIGVGTTCRVVRTQGSSTLTITEFKPDRTLATRTIIGPFELLMRCTFAARGPGRTQLDLHSEVQSHGLIRLLGPLMKPIFRRTMQRSLRMIRALVEEADTTAAEGRSA